MTNVLLEFVYKRGRIVAEVIMERRCSNCKRWELVREDGAAGLGMCDIATAARTWYDCVCPGWMAREPKLKPCPYATITEPDLEVMHDSFSMWFVHCKECDARGPRGRTRTEAIEYWNHRP